MRSHNIKKKYLLNCSVDVLRKSTAISVRFKNEAFNISECYYCQLLFLRFLNKILSGY